MSKFLDTIAGIAKNIGLPLLGAAVGGPAGVANLAVSVIKSGLGLPADTPEEQVAQAMQNATPEQVLALKKQEDDHRERIQQQWLDELGLAYADRKDARQREISTGDHVTLRVLAAFALAGFFGLAGWAMSGVVALSGEQGLLVGNLTGLAAGFVKDVFGYYFGSSMSSKTKDTAIANLSVK